MSAPILSAISRRGRASRVYGESNPIRQDVIDLSSDEIRGMTSDYVRAETIAAVGQHLADHYTRRPGILPLAQAVADLLARDAIVVDVANGIIIAGGVQESRFIGMGAVASNKTVYLPQPSCLSDYAAAALFANSRIEHFDPADTLPDSQDGVVLLPNPNPATGQVYTREALERLAHWVVERNLLVISDETLAPLCLPGISMTHLASQPSMLERTLILGSFANIPGLDAWLVSWIAGPTSLVTPARGLKLAITLCSAAASQYAALAGCSDESERRVAQDTSRIGALTTLLEQQGIPYHVPHTVAFVAADVSTLGGGDTVAAACSRGGVRVLSGSKFDSPGFVRITVANEHFEQGVERLNVVLTSLKKEGQSIHRAVD